MAESLHVSFGHAFAAERGRFECFQVLGSMILVVFKGMKWIRIALGSPNPIYGRAATLVAIIAYVAIVATGASRAHGFRENKIVEVAVSPEIVAGNWLGANYSASIRVAHDSYCYIPPTFEDVKRSWYWTIEDRDRCGPDVVVVHDRESSRFTDADRVDAYYHGASKYHEVRSYYVALSNEQGFELVGEFGPVQIYELNRP